MERKQLDSFLLNKYTILKKYKTKSLFDVYEGVNKNGEKVIIKTSKEEFFLKEILINEFDILTFLKLDSIPNVIEIIDSRILILKYIPGLDLKEHRKEYLITWEEIRNIFLQLLYILYELHQNKITHGDIKTENIILDRTKVFLIDFGGASFLNKKKNIIQFTPRYKDLVSIKGDLKEDIYCLFRVLLFLIKGSHEVSYDNISPTLSNFIRKGINKEFLSTVEVLNLWDFLKI